MQPGLIRHPVLIRAASLGGAAVFVVAGLFAMATLKSTWRGVIDVWPDAPIVDVQPAPEPEPIQPPQPTPRAPSEPIAGEPFDLAPLPQAPNAPDQTIPSGESFFAGPPAIRDPTWLERPDGRTFERFYPRRALERGVSGRAVLDCLVMASGRISCNVVSEEPLSMGFGQAALRISESFRMAPMTVDGRRTDGGRVQVPIEFRAQ